MAFILAVVTNTKVAKTATNFVTLKALSNYLNRGPFYCSFNK